MTRHHPVGLSVRTVAWAAVLPAVAVAMAGCAASSRVVSQSAEAAGPVAVPLTARRFWAGR